MLPYPRSNGYVQMPPQAMPVGMMMQPEEGQLSVQHAPDPNTVAMQQPPLPMQAEQAPPEHAVPGQDLSVGKSVDDRQLAQWGYHETKEFIALRAEMERDFVPTRNSKTMWEVISGKMKERGYRRTAAQCKCKWKVLVNRYKGKELSDESGRDCPFFDELDAIFKERARNVDRMLLESEGGGGITSAGGIGGPLQIGGPGSAVIGSLGGQPLGRRVRDLDNLDDDDDDDDGEEDIGEDKGRRRQRRDDGTYGTPAKGAERQKAASVLEVLDQFFVQQTRMEAEWRAALEKREAERRVREAEWRERLESLERERAARDLAWRQLEQERAVREEERCARRDQLIVALISRLGGPAAATATAALAPSATPALASARPPSDAAALETPAAGSVPASSPATAPAMAT